MGQKLQLENRFNHTHNTLPYVFLYCGLEGEQKLLV